MGRKKIAITRIQDERNRQITFSKRKAGLLKKAYELSILCDVEIAVVMITSNSKLYQYASTNMNSILIRYTEFKDPDESKTNADILEDITKKERGGGAAHDDSGDEEDAPPPHHQFLLTPRTHAQFRKIDEEFDHMLRQNQLQAMPAPLHSGGPVPQVPNAMPVSVPVTQSPSTIQQQIHQHLQQQLELRSSSSASTSSSVLGSASSVGFISPQSDLSSASPATSKGQKSPGSMPPPVNTPTRLQTLRNQTLKLHLPGSGRNYISLTPGGGGGEGTSPNKKGAQGGDGGEKGEEGAGGAGEGGGSKPQLRVYIPGQKEFVPRTQATSPLPQVGGLSVPGGQPGATTQVSTSSESLTTPILSLATPNMFSNLPPLFSSFMGEFPFGPSASATAAASGGGSDLHSSASALVAFPVSIQPSSVSGSSSTTGNIILQAQNMGQPFLLTPNYDPSRQNPLFGSPSSSSSFTPPTTLPAISPSLKDLEQLKHQYERVQQQLLQQQLLLSQTFQQQAKDSAAVGSTSQTSTSPRLPVPPHPPPSSHSQEKDSGLGGPQAAAVSQASRFSGVLMTSQSETATLPVSGVDTEPSAPKRPRLQAPAASSF